MRSKGMKTFLGHRHKSGYLMQSSDVIYDVNAYYEWKTCPPAVVKRPPPKSLKTKKTRFLVFFMICTN